MSIRDAHFAYSAALKTAKKRKHDLHQVIRAEVGEAIAIFDATILDFKFGTWHWEYELIPDRTDPPVSLRIDIVGKYRKQLDGTRRLEPMTGSHEEQLYADGLKRYFRKTLGLGRKCRINVVIVPPEKS